MIIHKIEANIGVQSQMRRFKLSLNFLRLLGSPPHEISAFVEISAFFLTVKGLVSERVVADVLVEFRDFWSFDVSK